ncbi:MAG: hypothetical protein LBG99_08275 [Propionibacteriaceae bacterium]|jgi:hypothetical protein|nr:hypothetical protein [Propionibacteriaceae bacterium]
MGTKFFKRGAAVGAALALALAGVGLTGFQSGRGPSAEAVELESVPVSVKDAPPTAAGPKKGDNKYIVGTMGTNENGERVHVTDIEGIKKEITPGGGKGATMSVVPEPPARPGGVDNTPVILAGDDIAFRIGVAYYNGGINYVPKMKYISTYQGNREDVYSGDELTAVIQDENLSFGPNNEWWPSDCAPDEDEEGYSETYYGGWCRGLGVFEYTLESVLPPAGKFGEPATTAGADKSRTVWFSFQGKHLDYAYMSGPVESPTGESASTSVHVRAIDPKIEVAKEVCSTGTGCAVDSADAPVKDADQDSAGEWVESAVIPSDSTTVQWRITVTNTGNAPLKDVHTAQDNWGYTDSADKGKSTTNSCEDLDFGTLAVDEVKSLVCESDITESLEGTLRNSINVNGTLEEDFTDPEGNDLRDRLRGNPEKGETGAAVGVIGSNTDIAEVSMPKPNIKLTKYVCDKGGVAGSADCALPTGTELSKLGGVGSENADGTFAEVAGQSQTATPGWKKEGTVAYGEDAQWLIVVSNTGNIDLNEISIEDTPSDVAGTSGDWKDIPTTVTLVPGESTAFTGTTKNVTRTEVPDRTLDASQAGSNHGEPEYALNSAIVTNEAIATAKDTFKKPVTSNKSSAEISTILFAIGDFMWYDDNRNGQQDGETPLVGQKVYLIQDGEIIDETETDANGYYVFDELTAGDYQILFTKPAGWMWTSQYAVNTESDSNANPATGLSEIVTLGLGLSNMKDSTDTSIRGDYVVKAALIDPTIDAGIYQAQPRIKVSKFVCDNKGDPKVACDVPSLESDPELLYWMAGRGEMLPDGTYEETASSSAGTIWKKEATIELGSTATWMIIVTNTGNVPLVDIELKDEITKDGVGITEWVSGVDENMYRPPLEPGESIVYTLQSKNVTNTNAYKVGIDPGSVPDHGEPMYYTGKDVVNTISATGLAWDPDIEDYLIGPDGEIMLAISNISNSEVNVLAPLVMAGGIALSSMKNVQVAGLGFLLLYGLVALVIYRRKVTV